MRINDDCVTVRVLGETTLHTLGSTPVKFSIDIEVPAPIVGVENSYDRATRTWELDDAGVNAMGVETLAAFCGDMLGVDGVLAEQENYAEDGEPHWWKAEIVNRPPVGSQCSRCSNKVGQDGTWDAADLVPVCGDH